MSARKTPVATSKLVLANGHEVHSPTAQAIEAAIRELDASTLPFAILSRAGGEFVQCYAHADGSFDLERQEGGIEKHYVARPRVSRAQVLSAFLEYAEGRPITLNVEWNPLEF